MRIFTAVVIVLIASALVAATEQPADNSGPAVSSVDRRDFTTADSPKETSPVWLSLKNMSYAERQNALIEIELFGDALNRVSGLAARIENLWNNEGRYAEALRLFDELGRAVDFRLVALGISWRHPIETTDMPNWGTDIRIGTRDSITQAHLDIHRASGNLFAVLLYQIGTSYAWSVNFSTNNGNTWAETYYWTSSLLIPDIGISVVTNYCFVGYFSHLSPFDARLRKFSTTNGQSQNFSGSQFITVFSTASPDTIREVELASNQDYFDNVLYYLAITRSGELRYYYATTTSSFETWSQIATSITNAERGLDACCNENFSSRFLWVSYYDTGDMLNIAAKSANWEVVHQTTAHSGSNNTSISAWQDTVICFYEYYSTNWRCRYIITYNGGDLFYYSWIGDTTVTAETPLTSARDGGGIAAVFRHYTPVRQGRYTRRNYYGSWSTPVQYTDYEPHWYPGAIEFLGGYTHGVVYITNTSPAIRAAMFDRHSATDIADSPQMPGKFLIAENYPNPFNSSTVIRYNLPEPARVTIAIYDVMGRKVASYDQGRQSAGMHLLTWDGADFASGVYLCKINTDYESQTLKMLLVK